MHSGELNRGDSLVLDSPTAIRALSVSLVAVVEAGAMSVFLDLSSDTVSDVQDSSR